MSRSELARRAGLSKPVVTEIVVDLLARGLIVEGAKGESQQGRKPILLEINRESMWVVGIDLAREHINVIITDLMGDVVQRRRETVALDRPEALAMPVTELVQRFISSCQYYKAANRSLRSRTVNLQSNGLAIRL